MICKLCAIAACCASVFIGTSHAASYQLTDGRFNTRFVTGGGFIDSVGFDTAVLNGVPIDASQNSIRYLYSLAPSRDGSPLHFGNRDVYFQPQHPAELQAGLLYLGSGLSNSIDVQILGPLRGYEESTSVLKVTHTIYYHQNIACRDVCSPQSPTADFALWTMIDADLPRPSPDDIGTYNEATGVLSATNTNNSLLVAVRAVSDAPGAEYLYDIQDHYIDGPSLKYPNGKLNSFYDVILLSGYHIPGIPLGESRTVDFYYLYSTDLDRVPREFLQLVPEPSSVATLALCLTLATGIWWSRHLVEISA